MSAPSDFRPLVIRLAPEYRRCAVYVAVGFLVIAATAVGFHLLEAKKTPLVNLAIGLSVVAVPVALLVAGVLRYRIKIDEHGVWRRRFVRWDLWPWEAFEQGRVRHGKAGDQITYPVRNWYWRTLSASFLADADRTAFETVVRRYRVAPPPPDLPEVVDVKYALRARFVLSADGVRLKAHKDDEGELIPWQDVVRAEVVRSTHDRPDFALLDLFLPEPAARVQLAHTKEGAPTWNGADAETIARYLELHLGDGQFQVTAVRGAPADLAEADRRLARIEADEKRIRQGRWTLGGLTVGGWLLLMVVMLEPWNWLNAANRQQVDWVTTALAAGGLTITLGLQGAMVWGVLHFRARDLRRKRNAVVRWKAAHGPAASELALQPTAA